MNSLEKVKEYYKNSSTNKLLELAQDPNGLRREVIPLLQAELIKRGEQDTVKNLDEFLSKSPSKEKDNGRLQIIWGVMFFIFGVFNTVVPLSNNNPFCIYLISPILFVLIGIFSFSRGIETRKKYNQDKVE